MNDDVFTATYFAGFFDGEGSIGVYMTGSKSQGTKYATLSAKLTNSVKGPLDFVLSMYGGSIENNKASLKDIGWQDTYSWRAYSDKAMTFLKWIYPYTYIKKPQIEIAFEFWDYYAPFRQNKYQRPSIEKIDEYILKLKQLKRGS